MCSRAVYSLFWFCCQLLSSCSILYYYVFPNRSRKHIYISGPTNFATRSSLIRLRAAREWLFMPPWNAQPASFHTSSERTEYLRSNAAPPGFWSSAELSCF